MKLSTCVWGGLLAAASLCAQDANPDRLAFENRCSRCHGADANGGEMGPPIVRRASGFDDAQLGKLIREGLPQRGMPANPVNDAELGQITRYLRSLAARARRPLLEQRAVTTDKGQKLTGAVLNQGFNDLQLRTEDGRIHLLRRAGES